MPPQNQIPVYIKVRVIGLDSYEIHFRVKTSTLMGKVRTSYAARVGAPVSSLRLYFNGQWIDDDETPEQLNVKNNDVIHVRQIKLPDARSLLLLMQMARYRENTGDRNAASDYIKLKVGLIGHDSSEIYYHLKMSTPMGRLKHFYAERLRTPVNSLRFLLDGRRINDDETPEQLGMKNNDVIQVCQAKFPGARSLLLRLQMAGAEENTGDRNAAFDSITLKVVGQGFCEIHFRLKTSTQMGKIKNSYAERVGAPVNSLRFLFDGRRINDDETPEQLGMKNYDVIQVNHQIKLTHALSKRRRHCLSGPQ
ncbi:unnamed protein product [Cyprideis torosa]|uniref:Uncharacterized protein n=1 Tax=Cyprideis torosa TaxID=163714 RepID=A0A7R8W0M5_9CRUS|nr:unnamed protein product [Cyprideis torosa]CAG0879721.1 unnamed protein product [Cyprideis torosa]